MDMNMKLSMIYVYVYLCVPLRYVFCLQYYLCLKLYLDAISKMKFNSTAISWINKE